MRDEIGTVYGVLLNDEATVARRAASFDEAPYRKPPVAPILYLKPRSTFAAGGATIAVPADPGRVRIDATVGAVIGRTATRVSAAHARTVVSGFVIVGDLTLPHESIHRPAIRQRCRDGFCPIGARSDASVASGFDPAHATIVVTVDGIEVHRRTLASLVRPLERLLADVTDFMTLDEGDILLLGAPDDMPTAVAGQRVVITVDGLAPLAFVLVGEAA